MLKGPLERRLKVDTTKTLDLQNYYPDTLKILDIKETQDEIIIQMHSTSKSCTCHKCGAVLTTHHGSHRRVVQDLPILGKRVKLVAQIYDYQCTSDACGGSFASTETFNGFLNYNSRMTERLEDFICMLAVETSCEASARIMQSLNAKVSGDTVIRLLLKRYAQQPIPECGSAIGVDDFAFKKRHTYGTIIVDEKTHNPVAILEGRDGKALKEWLKQNKHVTTVTRDRASAYAKAIEEVLPGCMQIADRFHIHQNLMDAVNKVLGREVPATNAIPIEEGAPKPEKPKLSTIPVDDSKKNRS
jgi:transposase